MARTDESGFSASEVGGALMGLLSASIACYAVLWALDFGGTVHLPWRLMAEPGARDTLSGLGEITVGVLGVALTVVAIILELAANRYTPRITELFLRAPINAVVMSLYVVTSVLVLWVGMSLYGASHPTAMPLAVVVLMTLCLASLLPYFAFVFDFVQPTRIVSRIRDQARGGVDLASRRRPRGIVRGRHALIEAVEHLGEMAVNAVDSKDKTIAISAVDALAQIALYEMEAKDRLPKPWFETESLGESDPDFVALHRDMVRTLNARRTWVLMKVMRQYEAVFREGLGTMRDIDHLIAIRAREIALRGAELRRAHDLHLSVRFLNTFMRAAINARDVRTCYNLLNEYRILAEHMVDTGWNEAVLELAHRMKEYGQVAFMANLPFILETAAYDLCALLERVHRVGFEEHDALLSVFMDVDREPDGRLESQENSLRGVRKAQVKLATYYLEVGAEEHIVPILEELRGETKARQQSIRNELLAVDTPEFWEVSDRGVNFDYLTPTRRKCLERFFERVHA